MARLPSELQQLIVVYLPNNQVVNYLAHLMFNNNNLNLWFDQKMTYREGLAHYRNQVNAFNYIISRIDIGGQIVPSLIMNGATNFHYQPGKRFVSNIDLMTLLSMLIDGNLLFEVRGQELAGISLLNKKLEHFHSQIRVVPIDRSSSTEYKMSFIPMILS